MTMHQVRTKIQDNYETLAQITLAKQQKGVEAGATTSAPKPNSISISKPRTAKSNKVRHPAAPREGRQSSPYGRSNNIRNEKLATT